MKWKKKHRMTKNCGTNSEVVGDSCLKFQEEKNR